MLFSALLLTVFQPQMWSGPERFGRAELAKAMGSKASEVAIKYVRSMPKEAYRITPRSTGSEIQAGDAVGAMYGLLDLAERLHTRGASAWKTKTSGTPYLADRGVNLFLTLPWNYAKNDTDYELGALTDPNRWWFHNADYWTTLLDLMAKSRLNWLDIHGSWDISSTRAPNLYAYFVTSPSFPKVGVPDDIKAANMRQLNHVIEMAHERGIRVSLMCYEANLKIPQNPNPGYEASEKNIYRYTAEVVEKMVRGLPKLDAIGFRIGESGHDESFFSCYDEGLKKAGRDIPLITRSWITRKQKVLPLARASKDFTVEVKYNGEQWGAPYPIMGGRMANWTSYSFEDYFSDSGPGGAKMWPGNVSPEGERWPSQPYKVVWQVRANGTHRIFPFYNPEWTRRSIKAMKLGTVSGYTIEGLDAYFPKSPLYYLRDPKDQYCNWIHQRDELYWMCWGRLGYDPNTPEAVFDARAKEMLADSTVNGTRITAEAVGRYVKEWKFCSTDSDGILLLNCLGPDHRNHAPELERGGNVTDLISAQGFDTHASISIQESMANFFTKGLDYRESPLEHPISILHGPYDYKREDLISGRLKELRESTLMSYCNVAGLETGFKLAAYTALSEAQLGYSTRPRFESYRIKPLPPEEPYDFRKFDLEYLRQPVEFFQGSTFYKPFTDRLRMHTNTFEWRNEAKKLDDEYRELTTLPLPTSKIDFSPLQPVFDDKRSRFYDARMRWRRVLNGSVRIEVRANAELAWLIHKPLPSSTFFHRSQMKVASKDGKWRVFVTDLPTSNAGLVIEAFLSDANRTKIQSVRVGDDQGFISLADLTGAVPYSIIPAQPGPTPQIYNAEEATRFLKPEKIDPKNYGGMLIGSRAAQFWGSFDRHMKRKLLDPVARGMRLVILQEDFLSRYKLDWMPKPLSVVAGQSDTFDPGGQLGLIKATAPGMMWQKFAPSEGWEIFGNGGLARLKHGKGEIWVTTARLMQNMHRPDSAKDFVRFLSLGGKDKPTILVDSGSEGAEFTTSCHPDLMNSHDIPFLTLGEVVAKEQGMDEYTEIPGPINDDDVLSGRGEQIANAFLKKQVQLAAARPIPTSAAALDADRVRRKAILMKSLGLDPTPTRTPLNARITGVIQRKGYRIEKVVFESRPKFFVTAHVYVPESLRTPKSTARGGGYPVIVHVNGHWAHKKAEDRLQLRNAISALNGYITISIDTPGWSFEGNSLIERREEGNHNDFKLVQGGSNTTGYYVWDAMRALDYMATRSDTDMDRVGITGASGGGLATLFIFAADDRYKAAVPVVYMSSMEVAPDNGCLCNHVSALNQIGDKSDVLAIQAPKPVYIMGAQNDGEFPPDGMRLTHKKVQQMWSLYGKGADTFVKIYAGGHDYNQLMREDMIGFFDKYLKGVGDGSPVKQPEISIFDPEDRSFLVLDPPLPERTMRDLSKEYLAAAPTQVSAAEAISLNGGFPKFGDVHYREIGTGEKRVVTFESEPGLVTPGIVRLPTGSIKGVRIVVGDTGKTATFAQFEDGYVYLFLDLLGTGELSSLEMRYPVYLGKSVAFVGGSQILAAAAEMAKRYSKNIEIEGHGPISTQAIMWAGLSRDFAKVTGTGCLKEWRDVFDDHVSDYAVQPRAHLMGSLENLRRQVKNATWK